MATAQVLAAQVEAVEKDIKQKENRLKELRQQHKAQESRERAHRLIERGAILESLIEDVLTLTNVQIKTFLEKTIQTEFARKILTQVKEQNAAETPAEQPIQQSENGEDTGEKSEIEQVTLDGN